MRNFAAAVALTYVVSFPSGAATNAVSGCSLISPGAVSAQDPNFASCSISSSYGSAVSDATSFHGTLKAGVYANSGYLGPYTGGGSASASATFFDDFIIGSSGLSGKIGTAVVGIAFSVEGESTVNATGIDFGLSRSRAIMSLDTGLLINAVGGTPILDARSHLSNDNLTDNGSWTVISEAYQEVNAVRIPWFSYMPSGGIAFDSGLWLLTVPIQITFGAPMSMTTYLNMNVATTGFLAEARLDARHSTYWAGISNVTYNSAPVNFTTTSSSGTDWTQSFVPSQVPELSSVSLMLFGLLVLGGKVWSTHRSCAAPR